MHCCFDGWEFASRLATDSRCGCILPRDLSRCTMHFFLFFYVGVHVLCIRCPGKHGCLRAWPSSCHSESHPPTVSSSFLPFSPLKPVVPFHVVIFALKYSYVMRRRVIRYVIPKIISFIFFECVRLFSFFITLLIRMVLSSAICHVRELFRSNALLLVNVTRNYFYFLCLKKHRIKSNFILKRHFSEHFIYLHDFSLLLQIISMNKRCQRFY